jgi:hypothetical protein
MFNKVKGIKINLDFIFDNFPVHRTGLRLVYMKLEDIFNYLPCGIYGNVFRSIRVILLGQTTLRARILLGK